ncbi:hypothetical protein KAJ38_01105 [Candidatus Pacearchaeota archaeon]|nr:hypothetical protein [Candidatus Pacearchaeota archaeon]
MPLYQKFEKNFKRKEGILEIHRLYDSLRKKLSPLGIQILDTPIYNLATGKESSDATYAIILPTSPVAETYVFYENYEKHSGGKSGRVHLGVKYFLENQKFSNIEKIALEHGLTPTEPFKSNT